MIIGAGAVGFDLARKISRREHDVVVIERDAGLLHSVQEQLNCRLVVGNGVNPALLEEVGMTDCDLFAAVTDRDEINIISALTAHRLGAAVKVARVRQEDYYRRGRLLFAGINLAINPDHEVVGAMRAVLFQTAATDVYEFAEGRVRIVGARVEADAMVAGKTLADIVSELGTSMALVTAIVRGETTLIPRGDTVIMPDDQIYLAGERSLVDRSLRYVHVQTHPLEKVMIVGANKLGLELARDLLITGIKVKIIDRSEEKCQRAAEQLRHALILHGDGTDVELLHSEGVDEMDGFVSLVRDEETNIMACLLARYHGAGKTVCLVNRPDYVPLLPLLGVDAAVSPRLSTAARIARFVKRGAVVSAENLGYSGAEILQIRLEKGSLGLNKPLAELDFPRDAVIGAVLKRGHVVTPRGDTVLEAGDEVVVFALPSGVPAVENFFTAE